MKIVEDPDVDTFLRAASELLYRDEATNSLMLGLCEGPMRSIENPILIRIEDQGRTIAAATQTPPNNLVITDMGPEAIALFCEAMARMELPGVVGPARAGERFAQAWTEKRGGSISLGMAQKIYRLEKVRKPPRPANGEMREATVEDRDLLVRWLLAFVDECLPFEERRVRDAWRATVDRALKNRYAHLWIEADAPRAMAMVSRPTRNGISINAVYTPREHRARGYASSLVACLSRKMLDTGKKFCVLYTDLANPTSNRIYQDVGYREIADSKHLIFGGR